MISSLSSCDRENHERDEEKGITLGQNLYYSLLFQGHSYLKSLGLLPPILYTQQVILTPSPFIEHAAPAQLLRHANTVLLF